MAGRWGEGGACVLRVPICAEVCFIEVGKWGREVCSLFGFCKEGSCWGCVGDLQLGPAGAVIRHGCRGGESVFRVF